MKKFYAVLLVLLTVCLCQLHALSTNGLIRVGNIVYQVTDLDNLTASVYKVDPSVTGTLTIPSTVQDEVGNEFSVTGLERECILNAPITKIVLPATLADNDGTKGFQYGSLACPTLKEIAIADGNTVFKVVNGVLLNANGHRLEAYPANKAAKSYTLPSSVVGVMPFAFAEARNLETLTINKECVYTNEQTTNVGAWANIFSLKNYKVETGNTRYVVEDGILYFQAASGKRALASYPAARDGSTYSAPDKVVTFFPYCISGASNLETINCNNVQYWGQPAIINCKNVKTITGTNSSFLQFKDNTVFTEKYYLYFAPLGNGGTYTVPDFIKGLMAYSFSYANYDKIIVPSSVAGIGDHPFWHSNVKEVDLSQFSGKIWGDAFADSKLEKVEFPASVSLIFDRAFSRCDSLKSVTFADQASLSELGAQAFFDDPALESINFGNENQCPKIGSYAFAYCPKLKTLSIPQYVSTLGDNIVTNDTNLAYIDLSNTELSLSAVDRTSGTFDGMDAHTLVFMPQPDDPASDVTGENIINVDETGTRTAASIALYSKATSFETPYSFTAKKVTYDRAFTNDTYATVAFPFALDETQTAALGKLYAFQNVSDNKAVFDDKTTSTTTAYQPYLLLSNGTAFSAENVKFEKASENSATSDFAACFEATNESGKLGLNSDFSATKDPVFRTLADGETVLPFHAYITSAATSLFVKGAEATSISNIRVNGKTNNDIYTLNGSKLSAMPTQPGVYIIGNKKVLVK